MIKKRDDSNSVYIKDARTAHGGVYNYHDLGMADKKTKRTNTNWKFLHSLIDYNGEARDGSLNHTAMRNRAAQLNKVMRSVSGIKQSIWKKDKTRDQKRKKCHVLEIVTRKGEKYRQEKTDEYENLFAAEQSKSKFQPL